MKQALIIFSVLLWGAEAAALDDPEACAKLSQTGKTFGFLSSNRLFYYDDTNTLQPLQQDRPISKRLDEVVYFIPTRRDWHERGSVINIKLVYATEARANRSTLVYLENDRWKAKALERARSVCSNLTVEGYDNFHLSNTRSTCLAYHFHQQNPDTLANPEIRRSFAFDEMVPTSASAFVGFFIRPAGAAPLATRDAPGRLVRSLIINYRYDGGDHGTCVRLRPRIPDNARSVAVRITNHGLDGVPESADWRFEFAD